MAVETVTRDEVKARLRQYLARFSMTATERYEADAEAFYRESGLMAPGKDTPAALGGSYDERRAAYELWVLERNNRLRDDIAAAILFL